MAWDSAPLTVTGVAGWKLSLVSGATFVKRQSSSRNVGKPCPAKLAMPAWRNDASHWGPAAAAKVANFSAAHPVSWFAFDVIFRIILIINPADSPMFAPVVQCKNRPDRGSRVQLDTVFAKVERKAVETAGVVVLPIFHRAEAG